MCFWCPYEGGEGVWVQDNPGAPERNGCIVAEGFGEQYNSMDKLKPSEGVFERLGDHLCWMADTITVPPHAAHGA